MHSRLIPPTIRKNKVHMKLKVSMLRRNEWHFLKKFNFKAQFLMGSLKMHYSHISEKIYFLLSGHFNSWLSWLLYINFKLLMITFYLWENGSKMYRHYLWDTLYRQLFSFSQILTEFSNNLKLAKFLPPTIINIYFFLVRAIFRPSYSFHEHLCTPSLALFPVP